MFRRVSLDPGRPNAETSIERLIRVELTRLGVAFQDQGHVGRYRPDFILPDRCVVIECDGSFWHTTPRQRAKDRHKDMVYKAAGYHVYRFTDIEIRQNPLACVARILAEHPIHAVDPDSQ